MIRKFARIDASADELVRIFADFSRWAEWFPGVRKVSIVHESEAGVVADLQQVQMGYTFNQRVECRVSGHTVLQRQLSGIFRRWQAEWSFTAAPEGRGTTVACEMVADLGLKGLLVPARFMQSSIDRIFEGSIAGARRELRLRRAEGPQEIHRGGETLLEIFETEAGLEVWVAGRRLDIA